MIYQLLCPLPSNQRYFSHLAELNNFVTLEITKKKKKWQTQQRVHKFKTDE